MSEERQTAYCGRCGRPVEFAYPRWQHSWGSLKLDEDHSAEPKSTQEKPVDLGVPQGFSSRRAFQRYLRSELKQSPSSRLSSTS